MDIYEIKRHKKRTIVPIYLGEKTFCDGCVARGGSEFKNIQQPIYLTSIHPERPNEIEKKYCYNCAVKELEKEIYEIRECWYQNDTKNKSETPKEPELLRCFKCGKIENGEEEKFKSYNRDKYCIDCLIRINDVLTAASNYNNKK